MLAGLFKCRSFRIPVHLFKHMSWVKSKSHPSGRDKPSVPTKMHFHGDLWANCWWLSKHHISVLFPHRSEGEGEENHLWEVRFFAHSPNLPERMLREQDNRMLYFVMQATQMVGAICAELGIKWDLEFKPTPSLAQSCHDWHFMFVGLPSVTHTEWQSLTQLIAPPEMWGVR